MRVRISQPRTFTPVVIELVAHTPEEVRALALICTVPNQTEQLSSHLRKAIHDVRDAIILAVNDSVFKDKIMLGTNHTTDKDGAPNNDDTF